jgi:hypothetical protein
LVSLSSCSDDESIQDQVLRLFSADMLMGSNEVPTNNSTAMGTATLNLTTLKSINWSGAMKNAQTDNFHHGIYAP